MHYEDCDDCDYRDYYYNRYCREDYDCVDYDDCGSSFDVDYGELTWDAMTDGMCGDYPGGGVDYERLGF